MTDIQIKVKNYIPYGKGVNKYHLLFKGKGVDHVILNKCIINKG